MSHKRMPMVEASRTTDHRIFYVMPQKDCSNWLVSSSESLGDCNNVRRNSLFFKCKIFPSSAQSTHDLVKYQNDAVSGAYLSDRLEISRRRRHRSKAAADHCFSDKRTSRTICLLDGGLQFLAEAGDVGAIRFSRRFETIRMTGRDVRDLRKH